MKRNTYHGTLTTLIRKEIGTAKISYISQSDDMKGKYLAWYPDDQVAYKKGDLNFKAIPITLERYPEGDILGIASRQPTGYTNLANFLLEQVISKISILVHVTRSVRDCC